MIESDAAFERLGAVCLMVGSALLAGYAVLFPLLLPVAGGSADYAAVVLHPSWVPLTLVAFIGVLFLLVGLTAVFSRIRATAGVTGMVGFMLAQVTLVLQACVLTWELLLDPVIAAHAGSKSLLTDLTIAHAPAMVAFRWAAIGSILVSTILFGLALYRSRQFPNSAFVLILIGAFAYALGPMVSIIVAVGGVVALSIGCILIGARMWRVERR